MTEDAMRISLLCVCVVLLAGVGCAPSERMTLQQINPSRIYKTTVPAFFDEVRLYSIGQDFRLERFEQESGRILGYKNIQVSSSEAGLMSASVRSKKILMVLKVKPKSETETSLVASFVYGDAQVVLSRSDEEELVGCYRELFRHLDEKFGPGQIPTTAQ
jgi:hypothetical protein